MSLLLALTAGGVVSADLSVTDASDTLVSTATLESQQPVSLGGRNKLHDVPGRRVQAALSVADESDQLYAAAKVAQLVRKAVPVVVPLANRRAALSVVDDADTLAGDCFGGWPEADTLEAKTRGSWPERYMITRPKVKMVSSKYEAVA